MVFGLSTGNFYQELEKDQLNIDPLIPIALQFNLDALEIATLNKRILHSSRISEKSMKSIRNADLKAISYHFPVGRQILSSTSNVNRIQQFLKNLPIKYGITHPYTLPDEMLKFDFPILLENINSMTFENFISYYQMQKDIGTIDGICFDTSHAVHFENDEIDSFFNSYENEIRQIHFGISIEGKDHLPFKQMNKDFELKMSSIQRIAKYVDTIIIEINYSNLDTNQVNNDIAEIINWLK